uniref:U-box domain-containing protein n=3 Tax=Oryza TaxID=4527 RepID=A0A0D3H685_9ORYZ
MVSLYGLLQSAANHGRAIAAGAVSALAALLLSADRDDLAGDSVALLARIAEQPSGAAAVLSQPGLVARLAEALAASSASSSRSARDHSVSLLASLCQHGGAKVVAVLGRMPGLMASLYSLVADGGSPQTSKKARALLNEIHRHYEVAPPPPASSASSDAGGDRVVRVL